MNAIYAITVVGTPIDVTNGFSYGRLAALVEARDQIIPRLHAEHDLLFAQFRDSVNSIHNQGTGWPPATTLTGTRTFATPATAPFQGTGTVRFGIIDRTTGGFVATYDLDLTALGATTVQGLVTNIDTALSAATGGSVTCTCNPGSGLQITSANPNYGIGIVSLGASAAVENTTQYGFSHYFGLNDLVTSPDVPSPGAVPTPGIAGQLAIRSDIVANPLLISRGQISAAVPAPVLPVKAITTGDGRVMQLLSTTLTANQTFVATGSLSQLQTPFTGYAAQIVATNAQQAAQVTTLFEEKQTHYNQIEADINRVSGVNIQEEMTTIFGWQALYTACTQCVKIVKENFQYLMNIF
jgi:flagellar hook-associated protein 1 FlgK